jgi:hypothetical protein
MAVEAPSLSLFLFSVLSLLLPFVFSESRLSAHYKQASVSREEKDKPKP